MFFEITTAAVVSATTKSVLIHLSILIKKGTETSLVFINFSYIDTQILKEKSFPYRVSHLTDNQSVDKQWQFHSYLVRLGASPKIELRLLRTTLKSPGQGNDYSMYLSQGSRQKPTRSKD